MSDPSEIPSLMLTASRIANGSLSWEFVLTWDVCPLPMLVNLVAIIAPVTVPITTPLAVSGKDLLLLT